MTFTDNMKNRMIAMIDYVMARSQEFGGVNISIQATDIGDGKMLYSAEIGCTEDGAEMFFSPERLHRWVRFWKDGQCEDGGSYDLD